MLLYVDEFKTLGDLQDKFSECYTGLTVIFYKPEKHHERSSVLPSYTLVSDLKKAHETGYLEIRSGFTIAEVQELFKSFLGLHTAVVFSSHRGKAIAANATLHELVEQALAEEKAKSQSGSTGDDEEGLLRI